MIPCRCKQLNTLSGVAATDYVTQHLDVVRTDQQGRRHVTCPETGVGFIIEATPGVYGGDTQVRLRRT